MARTPGQLEVTRRLQYLMAARRWDETRLAAKAGLDAGAVNRVLAGGGTLADLQAIARALAVNVADLADPPEDAPAVGALFRQSRGGGGVESDAEVRIRRCLSLLGPRDVAGGRTPRVDGPYVSFEDAERAAAEVRAVLVGDPAVTPLLSLPRLASERLGVVLLVGRLTDAEGASACVESWQFVAISPMFPPRMLFTLAHELGHLVAHHEAPFYTLDTQAMLNGEDGSEAEVFANAFASALLLPVRGIALALRAIKKKLGTPSNEVGDIDVQLLAQFFGVSFEVAAFRCERLTLLPRGGARALYEQVKKDHGSPEKRARESGLPARPGIDFPRVSPVLMERSVRAVREQRVSLGAAALALGLTSSDFVASAASADYC